MINANLSQFLDTGWFNEATLYLNGYTYWCEGTWDSTREKPMHFWVDRYRSTLHHTKDGEPYTTRDFENGEEVDYSTVFDIYGKGEDDVKEQFLQAKIFDGKSFWEVEQEIAWYDEN